MSDRSLQVAINLLIHLELEFSLILLVEVHHQERILSVALTDSRLDTENDVDLLFTAWDVEELLDARERHLVRVAPAVQHEGSRRQLEIIPSAESGEN